MQKYTSAFLLFFFSLIYTQQYNIQSYNTDNGLPQNSVKDIIKDKYGFIWLTTENGIVRYDGMKFVVYKNFPLNNQRFTFFYGYPEKDSIFTTGDSGKTLLISKRSPKVTKTSKRNVDFISRDNINYFLYSSNYIYTTSPGISLYFPCQEGIYFIRENSIKYINNLSKAKENLNIKAKYKNIARIFVIDKSVFFIDYQSKKVQKIERGKIVSSYNEPLLTDAKSKIYWSRVNNQVFIFNGNSIYRCEYEDKRFKISKLVQLEDITENIISVYYDKTYKRLYLGSSTYGLQIVSFTDFTTVQRPPSKPESVFYSTLPYGSSSVINTYGEVYNRNGLVEDKHFKSNIPFFLAYDQEDNVIARKASDLLLYQKKKDYAKIVSKRNTILIDFFFDAKRYYAFEALEKTDGTIGYSGVLMVYSDLSFKTVKKRFFFNDEPTKFLKFDKDYLLAGTTKGLYKVSLKTNKIINLNPDTELSIRNIIQSSDGNFWITTSGKGFYLLKNNRLIKMPYDADNNISSPHTILEDQNGFFWIPTNNGLYKVPESKLLRYVQDKKTRVNYYRFSKVSGFETNEFNGGSNVCGNKLGNGEFVLPSLDGLVFFNPTEIKSYYPENIHIERALIDGKERFFNQILNIKQESNRIDIFIDTPYYSNPDNLVIETKLSGTTNVKWESIGKDGKFSISNLTHGNHSFVVRVLVSDTGKYIYKKIHIIIPPYFYQTLWFKILISSALLLFIYFLVRWRLSFLKKRNHELEEIINSRTRSLSDTVEKLEITKRKLHKEIEQQKKLIGTITHDITTPVKFIALTAKEALNKDDFSEQHSEKILNSIYKSSDQLYNFTITLKEYSDIYTHHQSDKTELYSLHKLIEEKKILFNAIAENNNTAIINNVDKTLWVWIGKNILSAIVHNLLDNSVKFTKDGFITIESNVEGNTITLLIRDTGIGMDEKKIEYYTKLQDNIENEKLLLQKYGMGLHLVLQLLQMIEGKIVIKKNKLKGTTFKLILTNKKND
ncbi:sensor histidine kinase [Chryseobacterium lathyri]|uniref:Signal transduction histidine kinase n=1 Tax=Chryseobacterium lathyri TaxID=395933 RepID=A0ABT9SIW5_9FLAO|nr:ATP-binding protein [Chryseobacterium lathyri]MDP9959374.1 signal transduction histidine kinase [Chryseobacterium lathyri]